jgi:hypothetical protein
VINLSVAFTEGTDEAPTASTVPLKMNVDACTRSEMDCIPTTLSASRMRWHR